MSISSQNPSRAKRLEKGRLTGHDVGVSLHRVLDVAQAEHRVVIGAKALNIEVADIQDVDSVALVLSFDMFTLEDLMYFRSWPAPLHATGLELAGLDGMPVLFHSQQLEAIEHMVSNGEAALPHACSDFIDWLCDRSLAARVSGRWALTSDGEARARNVWILQQGPTRCFSVRGALGADSTRWEWMHHLHTSGLQFHHGTARSDVAHLAEPYVPGHSTKRWFVRLKRDGALALNCVCVSYLRCLATAENLSGPVPNIYIN